MTFLILLKKIVRSHSTFWGDEIAQFDMTFSNNLHAKSVRSVHLYRYEDNGKLNLSVTII